MKKLLRITGLIEGATGLGLLIAPSIIASLLLGILLTDPAGILLGRLGGAALVTIAFSCLAARSESEFFLVLRMMLGYNILATTLLLYAVLAKEMLGIGIWLAIILHAVLLAWSIICLSDYKRHSIHRLL